MRNKQEKTHLPRPFSWPVCTLLVYVLSLLFSPSATADKPSLDVLGDEYRNVPVRKMVKNHLRNRVEKHLKKRKATFRTLVNEANENKLTAHQKHLQKHYLDALNLDGFPRNAPLKTRWMKPVKKPGYTVHRALFESQPDHYVTAALFLPDREQFEPPYPATLVVAGHAKAAKGYEDYQKGAALAARNGIAAFMVDPIEQGERIQSTKRWGTSAHIAMAPGSNLVGRDTTGYEVFDNMRAIDVLEQRDDIDDDRIGVMGNSGGGTQTAQLLPADERIKAAAASSFISRLYDTILQIDAQDSEQLVYGQITFGMEHTEYLTMRAPTPVMINANRKDFFPIDATRETFNEARAFFDALGHPDRVALHELDRKHGWHRGHREAAVQWMRRWLRGEDVNVKEPDNLPILSESGIRVTDTGQVRNLPDYRSTYRINDEYNSRVLTPRRKRLWKANPSKAIRRVRALAGIRKRKKLPDVSVDHIDTLDRDGYRIRKLVLNTEPDLFLPALLYVPDANHVQDVTLYMNSAGKKAGHERLRKIARDGTVALAIDPRGIGETRFTGDEYKNDPFITQYNDFYLAYILGQSYVGMRSEDVIVAAEWLTNHSLARQNGVETVDLLTDGNVGIPALHAAALERELFDEVTIKDEFKAWSNLLDRPVKGLGLHTVHSALTVYDLPDLRTVIQNPGMVDGKQEK